MFNLKLLNCVFALKQLCVEIINGFLLSFFSFLELFFFSFQIDDFLLSFLKTLKGLEVDSFWNFTTNVVCDFTIRKAASAVFAAKAHLLQSVLKLPSENAAFGVFTAQRALLASLQTVKAENAIANVALRSFLHQTETDTALEDFNVILVSNKGVTVYPNLQLS